MWIIQLEIAYYSQQAGHVVGDYPSSIYIPLFMLNNWRMCTWFHHAVLHHNTRTAHTLSFQATMSTCKKRAIAYNLKKYWFLKSHKYQSLFGQTQKWRAETFNLTTGQNKDKSCSYECKLGL